MELIRPDWTTLPEDLLTFIAEFLHTRIDILRFRAVCPSFRSAVPPPPKVLFPNSILTTTDFLFPKGPRLRNDELFDLVESTTYAIQPLNRTSDAQHGTSPTWLIEVQESESGKVKIVDPLSKLRSRKLPKPLNLLDCRVTEINKSYILQSTMGPYCYILTFSLFPDKADDGFVAMAMYDFDVPKVGMWRNMDKKWSNIDLELGAYELLQEIIYRNQKFYILFSTARTVTVDPKTLTITQVASGIWFRDDSWVLYLVGSFKDLLLIKQYERNYRRQLQYCIKIFKLNEERRQWVLLIDVSDFVDRVSFLGDRFYSVSPAEFPGYRGYSVYFPVENYNSDTEDGKCEYPGKDTWICDLEDGIVADHISDFPGYSHLFWPPPAWLD